MAILKKIFQEMDTTNSGSITSEQFELGMRRLDVMSLFHIVELDVLDDTCSFQLLDKDQDGVVDLEGFVMGCLRMTGNANRIDIEISRARNPADGARFDGCSERFWKTFGRD